MTQDFLIPKQDIDKFYKMVFDKHLPGICGGMIGEYDKDNMIITLLPAWVPYLDQYDIKHIEMERYLDISDNKYRELNS